MQRYAAKRGQALDDNACQFFDFRAVRVGRNYWRITDVFACHFHDEAPSTTTRKMHVTFHGVCLPTSGSNSAECPLVCGIARNSVSTLTIGRRPCRADDGAPHIRSGVTRTSTQLCALEIHLHRSDTRHAATRKFVMASPLSGSLEPRSGGDRIHDHETKPEIRWRNWIPAARRTKCRNSRLR